MDGLSISDLLSALKDKQEEKAKVRLSDRNVIELVNKLKQVRGMAATFAEIAKQRSLLIGSTAVATQRVSAASDAPRLPHSHLCLPSN